MLPNEIVFMVFSLVFPLAFGCQKCSVTPSCPPGYTYYPCYDSCYAFITTTANVQEALEICTKDGASFFVPNTEDELRNITALLDSSKQYWIGFQDWARRSGGVKNAKVGTNWPVGANYVKDPDGIWKSMDGTNPPLAATAFTATGSSFAEPSRPWLRWKNAPQKNDVAATLSFSAGSWLVSPTSGVTSKMSYICEYSRACSTCPSSGGPWVKYLDKCYSFMAKASFSDAAKNCRQTNPQSVMWTPRDEEAIIYVRARANDIGAEIWIGLSRSGSSKDWYWMDDNSMVSGADALDMNPDEPNYPADVVVRCMHDSSGYTGCRAIDSGKFYYGCQVDAVNGTYIFDTTTTTSSTTTTTTTPPPPPTTTTTTTTTMTITTTTKIAAPTTTAVTTALTSALITAETDDAMSPTTFSAMTSEQVTATLNETTVYTKKELVLNNTTVQPSPPPPPPTKRSGSQPKVSSIDGIETVTIPPLESVEPKAIPEAKVQQLVDRCPEISPLRRSPPTFNPNNSLGVHMTFGIDRLISVDESERSFAVSGALMLQWAVVTCTPYDDENIYERLVVRNLDMVWRPRLEFDSAVFDTTFAETSQRLEVLIDAANGTKKVFFYWKLRGIFLSSCNVDLSRMPFDTQNCSFVVNVGEGSHMVALSKVALVTSNSSLDSEDRKWHLLGTHASKTFSVIDGTDKVSQARFSLNFERRPTYVLKNYVGPILLLVFVQTVSFMMPPCDSVRICFCVYLVLALGYLMSTLQSYVPPTPQFILLSNYFSLLLLACICADVASIAVHFYSFNWPEKAERMVGIQKFKLHLVRAIDVACLALVLLLILAVHLYAYAVLQ